MLPTVLFCILLASTLFSHLLTKRLRTRLIARAVMDIPNERSMHTVPVPRGGGLAVTATIMTGLVILVIPDSLIPTLYLLAALAMLAFISWLDDKKGMRVCLRLAVHLLAATIGSLALDDHAMLFTEALPFWADRLILILGWGWFMNLYNFMDGIDGITSVESITCAIGVGLFFFLFIPDPLFLLFLAALIIGSCFGFLKLNWHPAQIFLGDVGSIPLGFLIGFLLLKLATAGYLLPALLIPLYYLADSGITLTRRALKREKIWQAHRAHYYQKATAGQGSPIPVVLWILAANLGLVGCALIAKDNPWLGCALGVGIVVFLLSKLTHSAQKSSHNEKSS